MPQRTDLSAFAAALAERLPGTWRSEDQTYPTFEDQYPAADRLWDCGPAHSALLDYDLEHGAVLHGPGNARLSVTARPRNPRQFLVAALKPQGVKRHNISVVDDPMGISVTDDPVRAASSIARRLLPRYLRALDAVRRDARARPEPPHRPPAPEVAQSVTLVWYPDGVVGAPYDSVPKEAHMVLYSCHFSYSPDQYAFMLPASYRDAERALLIQTAIRLLTAQGIGVNFRHAAPDIPARPARPLTTGPGLPPTPANPPSTARR
ncbi:hypothetical protein [Streptomyces aurantiogriseus]|uniref:Uncharacterized protein n=1 Tax=Streptomyces aurantiogriseus TaxID=66870 RepID=A0A918FG41_9ACTN|nr:hypothetical protein [Streptomyces aurantiogriseus]GGR35694.1 hypothetical protein GCM10010251_60150 [Streptomyces aurantiogriseus]